ncbi:MAG TPA: 4Fe-4S binding protein [Candidatus Intestinimonas merdavium]|uniref:4Fe-4S binding protein n=2 Tax=Intestinimonas TaxID=1392389 RepID=A0A9D2CDG5_9FIRM|nr:4Fe-4S binding protein [Intestinimonas butyriciproducens]MBM6974399.1 4Fe-4S binding protein [Intestinimonas butyriciproducens]HIY72972.1 4Fe-4S binding protein [Candidatus Intestinimonas merdavium]
MEKTGRRLRRAFVTREDCVACGCCVKVCPLGAIAVVKGIAAQVDGERCVGCGKCARECPGTVIEIREVPA